LEIRLSLAALIKTVFTTSLGEVPLWCVPAALEAQRPAVLFINRPLAPTTAFEALRAAIGDQADLFWMQLPGDQAPHLRDASLAAFAAAAGEVIGQAFGARPVLLAGQGMGATLALAVQAPTVGRILAIEPELSPSTAWPVLPTFRKIYRERPAIRPLLKALYGASPDGSDAPSNLKLIDALAAPVDVVVGDEPLMPQRPVKRAPSLVGEPERAALRARPGVRVRVAPRSGTALLDQAPDLVGQALREAVAALAAQTSFDPALLVWAPLTARRVAYVGRWPAAFAAAYGRRNPSAAIFAAEALAGLEARELDLIVAADLAATPVADLAALLSDGGALIAGMADGTPEPATAGFDVIGRHPAQISLDRFDDIDDTAPGGARVLVARFKAPPAPPPLKLRLVSYAQRMMEIRTRLPAQALRSEPQLSVAYQHAPIGKLHHDTVFVLQRPAERKVELWRNFMQGVMQHRAIIVLEYDDHPEVIAKALSKSVSADDWSIFAYAHAVQTSTPELAAVFGRYNPEVAIFANAAFDLPPFPERPFAPKIFYGALARGDFPAQMARSLAPTLLAHPEASFEVVGDRSVFDALPTNNKRFHPLMPYEAYLDLMATCSVLLTPLEGDHYETKSDTKFLDAASRGLVTIASPAAYGATVRHGDNGLIANTLAEWAPLLGRVLDDPRGSGDMARRAFAYVRDQRMFGHQIAARRDWYAGLMARREALNAAVVSRLPGLGALIAAEPKT
jgi:hypothetical protein